MRGLAYSILLDTRQFGHRHWWTFRHAALNKNNRNPKGIVTDGTYLWVVNDNSTDKVFKYTLSGSLVGSWTISTSGATSPTGITLDLANGSDLWIVDAATDRVYQYAGAAARTSGSQSAATSFPLAAGNTNPQGIADPPTAAPGSTSFVAPAPTKLDAKAAAALARSAALPGTTTRLPQKPALARPARFIVPASPPQSPLQAIDTAVTELFDADEPSARPAAQKLLSIAPLVDELAAAMR